MDTATTNGTTGVAVLDIDGVLADVSHRLGHVQRRPKDWDAFFAAAPETRCSKKGPQSRTVSPRTTLWSG